MEKIGAETQDSSKENGGPPEWDFWWRKVKEGEFILIFGGDVTFRCAFNPSGELGLVTRKDAQREPREIKREDLRHIGDQARKIARYLAGGVVVPEVSREHTPPPPTESTSPPPSKPEQFELHF